MIARTGGEEFMVLMPRTARRGRVRRAASACARPSTPSRGRGSRPGLALTASIGVVSAPDATDLDGLERDADDRLYAAKRAGRDRAVAAA